MKKLTIFYLNDCPYCISAKKAVSKLQAEDPRYSEIEVEWLDESRINEFPGWCDYYYVPTIYLEEKKLYEAHPGDSDEVIMNHVKEAFEAAIVSEE